MTLIDANVILRYLLREPQTQAEQARAVIAAGAFTTIEVVAEVIYVLEKVYNISRHEIAEAIMDAARDIVMREADVLLYAIELYREHSLDFVDCVLAARARVTQTEVFSFDKKLMALIARQQRDEGQQKRTE